MTTHILNSAVMPQAGTYHSILIDSASFALSLKAAHEKGQLVSWIGYPQNAQIIEQLTGITVRVTRDPITGLEPGDVLLCMRLKYRTAGPKGANVNPQDFEYFAVNYSG